MVGTSTRGTLKRDTAQRYWDWSFSRGVLLNLMFTVQFSVALASLEDSMPDLVRLR